MAMPTRYLFNSIRWLGFTWLRFTCLGFTVAVIAGCGESRPDRVPVSGKVVIDGEPLTQGHVRFVPEDARPSIGQLNAKGEFVLTCFDGQDGAVPGRHQVEVIAAEELSATEMRWNAPKMYSDFATSGLIVQLDAARDDLLIELTWDGAKPYIERFGR